MNIQYKVFTGIRALKGKNEKKVYKNINNQIRIEY